MRVLATAETPHTNPTGTVKGRTGLCSAKAGRLPHELQMQWPSLPSESSCLAMRSCSHLQLPAKADHNFLQVANQRYRQECSTCLVAPQLEFCHLYSSMTTHSCMRCCYQARLHAQTQMLCTDTDFMHRHRQMKALCTRQGKPPSV